MTKKAIYLLIYLALLQISSAQKLSPALLNPKLANFPYSSLIDFNYLLDPPAGKYGFLKIKEGHFYWENGKRAKFWGINLSSLSLNIEKEKIDYITNVFAASGINLVRLEAIDNYNCLISEGENSKNFNPEYLDKLDYWIYKLKEKGIYIYLDLLDFRTFKEADGVINAKNLGRAAKPYAVFNPKLIELQKEYAEALLTHVNLYTHLKLIDDPAICLIELVNEHGLFIKADIWLKLVEPYSLELKLYWNKYLKEKYKNNLNLKNAWGKLFSNAENLENLTLELPDMSKLYTNNTFSQKLYDGCEFAYQIQKAYFSKMKEFLRALGVKTPMSAAVSTEFLADLKSVADELDFTAENFYWDHPSFEEGKLWKDPYYYNNTNQLKDDSLITFMPFTSILKWKDKPLVIREWAVPWPNSYRGASILEVVSYGSLQDFDCLILFSYRANKDIDLLREFSFQADIPVWGLMGICAKIFLNEDIGKAKNKINLLYKKEDLFYPGSALNILYKLSWITQMENASLNGPVSEDSSIKFKKSGFDLKNLEIKDLVFKTFKNKYLENNIYLSDTKEIKKDLNQGKIEVNAPKVSAIAGDLSKETALGALKSNTITPFGTLMAVSLDNKNLNDSNYFLIKMTTLAENSNQLFYKDINSFYPQKYKLINRGNSPITTLGEPSQIPTTIFWKGRKIFEIFLKNGSFELIFDQDKWLFACDTPGIKVKIYPDFEKTKITAYFYDNLSSIFMNNNSEFNYPAYCKYLEITLLKKIKNTGGGPISPYILLNLLQEFNL